MGLCPGCGLPVDLEVVGVHCMDCDPTGLAGLLTKDLGEVKQAHRDLRSAAIAVLDLFGGSVCSGPHARVLRELGRLAVPQLAHDGAYACGTYPTIQ